MANGPEVLAAEYQKFVAFMKQYAEISIAETKGDPPNTYVLTFDLKAYVPDEDGIAVSKPHSIRIRLTPGFPQKAPEVMALTPIYHPAVDEDDGFIDVSAQWSARPGLPQLVEHIAALITGAVYNMAKPANPDAVSWYDEHVMELPLDAVSRALPDEEEEDEDDAPAPAAEDGDHPLGALAVEFDPAAGMEDELDAPDPQEYEAQIQEIRALIEQEQFFLLDKKLSALPSNLWFPERSEAENLIAAAKQEVKRLFAQAKALEEKGELGKAMKYAQAILDRIPDHPEAKALASRLQQSSFLADSLDDALADEETFFTPPPSPPSGKAKAGQAAPAAEEEETPKRRLNLQMPEGLPLLPILLGILGVVFLLWLSMLFMDDRATLGRVHRGIAQGETLMRAKSYAQAKDSLERTKADLKDLHLLFFRKGSLVKQIDKMLNSSELKDGVKGQVKYKGRYVSEATARALEEVDRLEGEAQGLLEEKQYEAAQRAYSRALQRIASNADLAQERERLEGLVKGIAVERLLDKARAAEQTEQWDEAVDYYKQAERQVVGNPALAKSYGRRVQESRSGIEFRQDIYKATKAMGNNRLDQARASLQQADRKAAARGKSLAEADRQLLAAAHLQLEMSAVLPEAKRHFETRRWKDAANLYQQALTMADEHDPATRRAMADFLGSLERYRDLALANQSLNEARAAAGGKDWGVVVRLEKEALDRISGPRYAKDAELAGMRKDIEGLLTQHRKELAVSERGRALEARGMNHILSNFPTFKAENLSPPKATFLRREGSRLIYELSSLDKSQGRPTKLTMRFAFDEKSGQWIHLKQ